MEGFDIGGAQSRKREVAPLVFEREREIGVCCVTSTGWLSLSGPDLVKNGDNEAPALASPLWAVFPDQRASGWGKALKLEGASRGLGPVMAILSFLEMGPLPAPRCSPRLLGKP